MIIKDTQQQHFFNIITYLNKKLNINQENLDIPLLQYINKYKIQQTKQVANIVNTFYQNIFKGNNLSLQNSCLSVKSSATTIITDIFDVQVDDNTLVITTDWQHPSVEANLVKCKNLHIVNILNFNITTFQNLIKTTKFKKCFVYCIGTIRCIGVSISNQIFQQIIMILKKYNKQFKIAIDACHELFLTKRGYAIFDYIVYTAHAIIKNHQFGLLISKNNFYQELTLEHKLQLTQHFKALQIINSYINTVKSLKTNLLHQFSDIFQDQKYSNISDTIITQFNTFCIHANNIFLTERQLQQFNKNTIFECEIKDNQYIFFVRLLYLVDISEQQLQQQITNIKQFLFKLPYVSSEFLADQQQKIKKSRKKKKYVQLLNSRLTDQQRQKLSKYF